MPKRVRVPSGEPKVEEPATSRPARRGARRPATAAPAAPPAKPARRSPRATAATPAKPARRSPRATAASAPAQTPTRRPAGRPARSVPATTMRRIASIESSLRDLPVDALLDLRDGLEELLASDHISAGSVDALLASVSP